MELTVTLVGLFAFLLLWLFGFWREKRHVTGEVPLVPPIYIQILALVGAFVFLAHLVALITGIDWKPPFQR
ncbi:hypothetical protein [Kordiimonas sp.]|uniref:hypothetical protein n=1 Tax=Kordiimonas sp. TaxID=1970157 RepID=UPI003A910DF2